MDKESKGVMVHGIDQIATKSLELGFIKQTEGLLDETTTLEVSTGTQWLLDSLAAWESHLRAIRDNELCLLTTCASALDRIDYMKIFLQELLCRMISTDRQQESRKSLIVASGPEMIDLFCDPRVNLLLQITRDEMESLCSVISATFGTQTTQRLEQAFDLPSCDACAEYVAAVPNTMTDVDQGRGLEATQAMVLLLKAGAMSAVGKRRMFAVLERELVLARKQDRISEHQLRSNNP